jgi:quercetin dioxygenase-like cupin family protein
MEAHLDAEADVSPSVYAGRLAGYASVAEHAHPGSWEVLCAVDANGTFIVDNVTKTLHSRQVVVIPPGAKHAWQPVAGSHLQAVQFYVPPGPEQRFKALAGKPGR